MHLLNQQQQQQKDIINTNSPVNNSNGSSSSTSSTTSSTNNNSNETDSGRHSMSDSPCSIQPSLINTNNSTDLSSILNSSGDSPNTNSQKTLIQNDLYAVKLVKTGNIGATLNNSSAGTFTSKCTLSTGNSVTLSQTAQNLQPKQQPLIAAKRPMSRSSSKDSYPKSSSNIATNGCISTSSCNNNSSNTSINLNKF